MKYLIFLASIIPLISGIGFTLEGNQEFCLYIHNPQNNTEGSIIFRSGEYNDKLIEFKAVSPSGKETTIMEGRFFRFHEDGSHQFCAKNLEYRTKNATIFINNVTIQSPAQIGNMNSMEYFLDNIYQNLNYIDEGVKAREQLSVFQSELSISNNEKLTKCSIAKIVIVIIVVFAQICVLKYFINHKE